MVLTSANHVNSLECLKECGVVPDHHFNRSGRCFRLGGEVPDEFSACITDCTMDLTARLEYLLRVYAAGCRRVKADADLLREQFRKDLEPLVAQYGQEAVIAALDGLTDSCPSVSLH